MTFDPHPSYPPPPPPAPGGGDLVGPLKVFFLVSLIVNAITTVIWFVSVLGVGAATCGLGCLLIIIPVIPTIALVLDAQAVSKLNQPPNPATYQHLKTTAILDIVSGVVSVGLVPLVMGILALLHLQKPEVQRAFGSATAGF